MKKTKFKQTEIGMIPKDWRVKELGELLKKKGYIRGPFGSALRRPELKSKGIPVYEQQNAIYNHRIFRYYIDDEKYKKLVRFTVEENDLVISCSGTFGKVTIIKKEDQKGIISQALLILRPDRDKINPIFLKYFFSSKKGYYAIASRSLGSVQINIAKRKVIEKIELAVPPLNEQEKIVKILSDIDSKIELLQEQNKTLEEIGQAIFKHWFVDFEFPNDEGKPYKNSGGEMKESEMGEIPKDWEISQLDGLANISIGRTPPRIEKEWFSTNIKDIKWISIKDMGKSGTYIPTTSEYLTKEAVERFNIPKIPKNTVILSFKLTIGRIAITTEEMLSNEAIAHINLIKNSLLTTEYIYFFLKKTDYSTFGSTSSIATAINSKIIKQMPIIIPSRKIINEFQKKVKILFEKILLNTNQIQNTQKTRDLLLPKLMSGKIRVPTGAD